MSNLADELRTRISDMPDKYTLAWWQEQLDEISKGYRGATHGINRCLAEYETCWNTLEEVIKRCEMVEHAHKEMNAILGELRAEVKRIAEKQDKIAEYVKKNVKPQKETGNDCESQ